MWSFDLTGWVVVETGNGLARSSLQAELVETVRRFSANPRFNFISVTVSLRQRALDLYARRPDKAWGIVDCTSFIAMADEVLSEAFTRDRHFEQAGFTCLQPVAPA